MWPELSLDITLWPILGLPHFIAHYGRRSRDNTVAHYALALDVGGTFTDVMLMHRESGQLWTVKTPSTPADASEGFFQGIEKIVALAGVAPAAVDHVLHGS